MLDTVLNIFDQLVPKNVALWLLSNIIEVVPLLCVQMHCGCNIEAWIVRIVFFFWGGGGGVGGGAYFSIITQGHKGICLVIIPPPTLCNLAVGSLTCLPGCYTTCWWRHPERSALSEPRPSATPLQAQKPQSWTTQLLRAAPVMRDPSAQR